jgi:hypothetical protein
LIRNPAQAKESGMQRLEVPLSAEIGETTKLRFSSSTIGDVRLQITTPGGTVITVPVQVQGDIEVCVGGDISQTAFNVFMDERQPHGLHLVKAPNHD